MAHVIGILGGSGLYDLDGLEDVREETVDTPYGAPSAPLVRGRIGETELVFLARHGRGHVLSPSKVPYRANIWALKEAGVKWLVSVSAVGSLQEQIAPGHVVLVDQFIDRTRGRASTFFDEGIVAHISFGDPVCPVLRGYLLKAAKAEGATAHDGGTYLCMEGPAFSTRAESNLYRRWGAAVIGMTNLPEAKLAREAEMSYATLALSTDYDCWHPDHGNVSVEQVIDVLLKNVALARRVLRAVVPLVAAHEGEVKAHRALKNAILTSPGAVDPAKRAELDLLVRGYLG
ncbi:MAG: S-methyl-5'-thioadenosine phosphorylase [Alphaproteobacteria bacterium]|nr:S-methyl-5'-thioadenosine phosphorylase [Alphaproteobacteria bacterium]MCB9690609.1 S-methyl-5'-thioadenosine phosphorylase [Alphaproteobacteria bacterium]